RLLERFGEIRRPVRNPVLLRDRGGRLGIAAGKAHDLGLRYVLQRIEMLPAEGPLADHHNLHLLPPTKCAPRPQAIPSPIDSRDSAIFGRLAPGDVRVLSGAIRLAQRSRRAHRKARAAPSRAADRTTRTIDLEIS